MAALSSYTPISTQTLSSGSTEITFNSFSGYTDLVLVCNVFGTANYSGFIRFNGDTGSNYSYTQLQGNGTSASSNRQSSQTSILILSKNIGFDTSYLTTGIINIQNYANSTTYKTVLSRTGVVRASVGETAAYVGTWRNTAAITSFTIISDGGTYASGSTFSLYGIANNTAGAKATGGVISSDSSYFYHSFYATDTFTPTQSLTCDYLVVAGGGGGGFNQGGGGGAGGFRTSIGGSPLSVTATGYTITVGAGGTAPATTFDKGGTGGNSTFSTITSDGGGGGGSGGTQAGANGGSGGGNRQNFDSNTRATGISGQGNNGGLAVRTGVPVPAGGGGGGGAGAVGGDGTASGASGRGGNGGVGLTSTLNAQGIATYYAGGGGAGGYTNALAGTGGLGGGGDARGDLNVVGLPGTANTGGGGGAGGDSITGGAGGSGVVIIRYAR
jgi:hypothetical protein